MWPKLEPEVAIAKLTNGEETFLELGQLVRLSGIEPELWRKEFALGVLRTYRNDAPSAGDLLVVTPSGERHGVLIESRDLIVWMATRRLGRRFSRRLAKAHDAPVDRNDS